MPMISDLERLAALHRDKVISDAEFAEAKRKILYPEDSPAPSKSPEMAAATQKSGVWRGYWGRVAVGFGVLGALFTTYMHWNRATTEGLLLLVAVDPLCFIGFPLGIYWIRTAPPAPEAATATQPIEEFSLLDWATRLIAFGIMTIAILACVQGAMR